MSVPDDVNQRPSQERHTAEVELKITENTVFTAKASITTGGLLAVAALVSGILLSTSIVVIAASRAKK